MIGDVINTFTKTTPAVNQDFSKKAKVRQVPVTMSHTRKIDISIIFRPRHFAAQCFKFLQ